MPILIGNFEASEPTRRVRHVRKFDLRERSDRAKNDGAKRDKVAKLAKRREARIAKARRLFDSA